MKDAPALYSPSMFQCLTLCGSIYIFKPFNTVSFKRFYFSHVVSLSNFIAKVFMQYVIKSTTFILPATDCNIVETEIRNVPEFSGTFVSVARQANS